MFSSIRFATRHLSSTRSINTKKVAVVLSGSGVYDGSEIHEASSTLVHLSHLNYEPVCFAPDIPQMHVIDHSKGCPSEDRRNVLVESARIARGKIHPLKDLKSCDVAAAIFPGGFGVAKNLSDFAVKNENMTVDPELAQVINELREKKRPLGFICIAPILAAKLIPGVKITLGQAEWPFGEAISVAKSLGAKVELCNVDQVVVCSENLVVSTPAFMYDSGSFSQIYNGVGLLVEAIDKLIQDQNK